ncbi:hypothetical protein ACNOYE_34090 [Nannocystaceae bacterium ST9]
MRRRTIPILLGVVSAAALACDCESPEGPGNQSAASLEACPELPPDVTPIEGLSVARASERFDDLILTLSTRPLACGEPAAQHGYCPSDDDRGVTIVLQPEQSVVGTHALDVDSFVEFETPTKMSVNAYVDGVTLEIFTITDECVTGRIVGLESVDGPFDGGFRAPRCSP